MRRDRNAEGVEREEMWEGCHLTIQLEVWGPGRRNLPSGVKNGFCAYRVFEVSRLQHFSVFWGNGGAPKTSRGPGNPPLDGPARLVTLLSWLFLHVDRTVQERSRA